MTKNEFLLAIIFIALIIVFRLLPHPANFAPVGALALLSGYFFPRRIAFFIPFLGMLVSDAFIGWYSFPIMASVYGSFALIGLFGGVLKDGRTWKEELSLALTGSLLFFFVTNTAVWLWSGMYEKSIDGLWQSYFMAIPFFKYTLASDLFYTFLLFGIYDICVLWKRSLKVRYAS